MSLVKTRNWIFTGLVAFIFLFLASPAISNAEEACFKITSYERSVDNSEEASAVNGATVNCVAQGYVYGKFANAPVALPVSNIRVSHPALCDELRNAYFSQKFIKLSPYDSANSGSVVASKALFSDACQEYIKPTAIRPALQAN